MPLVKLPQVLAYLPLQGLQLRVFPAHHTLQGGLCPVTVPWGWRHALRHVLRYVNHDAPAALPGLALPPRRLLERL